MGGQNDNLREATAYQINIPKLPTLSNFAYLIIFHLVTNINNKLIMFVNFLVSYLINGKV